MSDPSTEFSGVSGDTSEVARRPTQVFVANSLLFNVIVPLALLALGVGFIFVMGKVEPKSRPADDTTRVGRLRSLPPVRVERLQAIDVNATPLQLSVDGSVVPFREARVAAEVAGQIIYKSDQCETGSFVRKDQLLMKIDRTDYDLEVERLTRLKEQEYQSLAELDQELQNTMRSLDVAKQDLALQQAEVDRQMALPEGFASRGEIDRAKRSLLQATQSLVTFENTVDLLKKRRVRLESSERLAATQLKVAELNLARTEIRAPIEGVIVTENADLNSFVARGNTLVTIEDTSKVEVAANLRMDQLYWVLDQATAATSPQTSAAGGYELPDTRAIIEYELNGRDFAVYRWGGRLLGYDGIGLDPDTRTVPVRFVVDEPREFLDQEGSKHEASGPSALVRGMYVRVHLLIKPKTPLVVIPAAALKPGNRVWQFIPDESVLDINEAIPTGEAADQPADSQDQVVDPFDPQKWAPGRVVVRQSIYPVDSLYLRGGQLASRPQQGERREEQRMWVCEVRDQTLVGDSLVVTSPLAAVDEGGLPARADAAAVNVTRRRNLSVAAHGGANDQQELQP